jgi:hypothetical protein
VNREKKGGKKGRAKLLGDSPDQRSGAPRMGLNGADLNTSKRVNTRNSKARGPSTTEATRKENRGRQTEREDGRDAAAR